MRPGIFRLGAAVAGISAIGMATVYVTVPGGGEEEVALQAETPTPNAGATEGDPSDPEGGVGSHEAGASDANPEIRNRVTIGYAHWGTNLAESLDTLVGSKSNIVIGRVVGADSGRVVPFADEPAGESPPPDNPKANAPKLDPNDPNVGVPWTNYSVEIVKVIRSATLTEGEVITISQEGGLIDGVAYELDGDRVILVGSTGLFFVREATPGVFVVAPFMRFPLDGSGHLQPVDAAWADLPAVKSLTGLTVDEAVAKVQTAMPAAAP